MSGILWYSCLLGLFITANANPLFVVAVVTLTPRAPGPDIVGMVQFTETENGVHVTGSITGLPPGKYGFHVHELGDISTCDASGAHFNPDDTIHGGQDHTDRHVGDLGNIDFVTVSSNGGDSGVATVDLVDRLIALRGRNNIVGRTLVLHEQEDDLGLGGHETSLTTGNAGARVACGVIGLQTAYGLTKISRN